MFRAVARVGQAVATRTAAELAAGERRALHRRHRVPGAKQLAIYGLADELKRLDAMATMGKISVSELVTLALADYYFLGACVGNGERGLSGRVVFAYPGSG